MTLNSQPGTDLMKLLAIRMRRARKKRKVSQAQLARQIGISPAQVSMIETGQSGPSIRTMVAIASTLNVSLDYLNGLVNVSDSARDMEYLLRRGHAEHNLDRETESKLRTPPIPGFIAEIALADIRNLNNFMRSIQKPATSMIRIPRKWIEDRRLTPGNCRLITVIGESMEPTLPDGSSILLHLLAAPPDRKNRAIYLIATGNELTIRRAKRNLTTGWQLVSDNPDKKLFPTHTWPVNANIMGQVIWHGKSFDRNEWIPPKQASDIP